MKTDRWAGDKKMKKTTLDLRNAANFGRTIVKNDILYLVMSACGCGFVFTGKKLIIEIGCDDSAIKDGNPSNFPRAAVFVDGKPVVKKVIDSEKERFVIVDEAESVQKKVKIIKLSEAAFSIVKIYPVQTDDEASVVPIKQEGYKIEFIGDSITCGYGVDDANINSLFSAAAENAMKSYAYLTARLLNAQYSMFSASGYGIISGYTDNGEINLPERIPPYYESYGFSYSSIDGVRPHEMKWDFGRYVPDLIVINLGTNDNSYCKGSDKLKSEFEDAYLQFLKCVRKNNPDSEILCVLGIMETELFPCIQSACERMRLETGEDKLRTFELSRQDGLLGYSCNWHPSEDTHALQAEKLAAFIEKTYPVCK